MRKKEVSICIFAESPTYHTPLCEVEQNEEAFRIFKRFFCSFTRMDGGELFTHSIAKEKKEEVKPRFKPKDMTKQTIVL